MPKTYLYIWRTHYNYFSVSQQIFFDAIFNGCAASYCENIQVHLASPRLSVTGLRHNLTAPNVVIARSLQPAR